MSRQYARLQGVVFRVAVQHYALIGLQIEAVNRVEPQAVHGAFGNQDFVLTKE